MYKNWFDIECYNENHECLRNFWIELEYEAKTYWTGYEIRSDLARHAAWKRSQLSWASSQAPDLEQTVRHFPGAIQFS